MFVGQELRWGITIGSWEGLYNIQQELHKLFYTKTESFRLDQTYQLHYIYQQPWICQVLWFSRL